MTGGFEKNYGWGFEKNYGWLEKKKKDDVTQWIDIVSPWPCRSRNRMENLLWKEGWLSVKAWLVDEFNLTTIGCRVL
jgi:hypothetical protein